MRKRREQALKTGESKDFYRRELEKMGWQITAVNYDKPDYVKYEIVKGNSTYEVQIDFDNNSRKATKVDVATNAWKAEGTGEGFGQTKTTETRTGTALGHDRVGVAPNNLNARPGRRNAEPGGRE